ncbi:hypothetical protein Cni_G22773 [Canna indica]|uniref:Uncharacterized protein n=1 Tax=Canna indica TaxID=4628 RepID=A0AAQ3QLI8_9LILI|nr:hypothetical protein Cni_G22773 [Canna indica]
MGQSDQFMGNRTVAMVEPNSESFSSSSLPSLPFCFPSAHFALLLLFLVLVRAEWLSFDRLHVWFDHAAIAAEEQ